jgi:hypothetical protein
LFAESSFSATTGFVIAIVLLFLVRYMMARETRRSFDEPEAQAATGPPAPPGGPAQPQTA